MYAEKSKRCSSSGESCEKLYMTSAILSNGREWLFRYLKAKVIRADRELRVKQARLTAKSRVR